MFRRLFSYSWLGLALARPLLTAAGPVPAGLAGVALPLAARPAEALAHWMFPALTAGGRPASGAS